MNKPVIGITLDHEEKGEYAPLPFYALRENYCRSVAEYGGVPLTLPHEPELAESYLDMIDGLVVTGGDFDIDPSMYGATEVHETVTTKDKRTQFEIAMLKGALQRDMPVLGICAGEQLMNVILGGTLVQHIPDSFADCLEHEQPNPRTEPGHDIDIVEGTLLHRLAGASRVAVNSSHHQAVDQPGKGVVINCYATDGVVEGIEAPSYRWCLGVEWHPEYLISEMDRNIFQSLIEASRDKHA